MGVGDKYTSRWAHGGQPVSKSAMARMFTWWYAEGCLRHSLQGLCGAQRHFWCGAEAMQAAKFPPSKTTIVCGEVSDCLRTEPAEHLGGITSASALVLCVVVAVRAVLDSVALDSRVLQQHHLGAVMRIAGVADDAWCVYIIPSMVHNLFELHQAMAISMPADTPGVLWSPQEPCHWLHPGLRVDAEEKVRRAENLFLRRRVGVG